MTIAAKIADWFQFNEWAWAVRKDGISSTLVPNEDDVQKTLDSLVPTLYSEPIGTQVSTGRLIIRRDHESKFDVYMLVGTIDK